MSNTYHHGYKAKERMFKDCEDSWKYYLVEPKWHRRIEKHKKRRSECRKLNHSVMRGNIEQIWPLDKKPWVYYW